MLLQAAHARCSTTSQKLSLRFYDNNEVGRVMSRVTSDVDVAAGPDDERLPDDPRRHRRASSSSIGFLLYFDCAAGARHVHASCRCSSSPWRSGRATRARAFIRVRQAIAVVNANLQENVSGVRVIQSLSREDENAKRFDRINPQNLNANVDAGRAHRRRHADRRAARRRRDGAGRSSSAATAC